MIRFLSAIILSTTVFALSGCGGVLSNLRQDLNGPEVYDEPTVGGLWPEGGMLDRGVEGRTPAGEPGGAKAGDWVNPDQQSMDSRRRPVSYSNEPNHEPPVRRRYRSEDFIDRAPSEGSLWASTGQTNYFFTKNKIKNMGDLVTIQIEDRLISDVALELKKSLNRKEMEFELERAQKKLEAGSDQIAKTAAAPARAPAAGQPQSGAETAKKEGEKKEVRDATYADINLRDVITLQPGETMMGEVLERYPNGNYKIRASKRIMYGGTQRMVTLVGIARSSDVNESETINSGQLYEYRLKVFR